MKTLRYMSVQPAINYYSWQVEVMLDNFMKMGINPNYVDVVCSLEQGDGVVPPAWSRLAEKYNTVRFFFYNDTRTDKSYISSVRPHILQKHFLVHPELRNDVIFYHDCDMIFTRPVDWSEFIDDDVWYLSDTNGYINSTYIRQKGEDVYEGMCQIIGIDKNIPIKYDQHGGGAQYIMKNVDHNFWKKVEDDSNALWKFFCEHLERHPLTDTYHPIQKWTADMWAVLWNAWYFGHDTKVVPEMDFSWPTQGLHDWNKTKIFHNAGVTEDNKDKDRMFFKGSYMRSLPYDIVQEDFDPSKNSSKYVEQIIETGKTTCLK